ncbi:hypothetical protein [Rufibacter latericius]|nr:hypothetical protein [Rufibacter latericius]
MKTTWLLVLFVGACLLGSCDSDEDATPEATLQAQWQMYSNKVLVLGGNEACAYKTTLKDMDFTPTASTCQDDDVYDFRDPAELVIRHGTQRCSSTEPASTSIAYERQGDKLFIGGREHTVVHLTRDTLILDVCVPLAATGWPATSYGKVGLKLTRIK